LIRGFAADEKFKLFMAAISSVYAVCPLYRAVVFCKRLKGASLMNRPEAHQRLLDIAARADAEEGIRQGLDDVARGRTRPAREVFDQIRRKYDIPR
jgi:hypothetical protein